MVAVVGVPGAAIVHRQKKIVAVFRAAGATSAERAMSSVALGVDEGMAFRILRRHDIVRAAGERCYLDEPRWEAHRARRKLIALIAPIVILVALAITFWIVRG